MAKQNNSESTRSAAKAGAVLLFAAVLVAAYFGWRPAPVRTLPPPPPPPPALPVPTVVSTSQTRAAAELSRQIDVIEQQRQVIERTRQTAFQQFVAARASAAATNDFLVAELQKLQQQLSAAIEAHPAMVARRQQMQRLLDEMYVTDTNSAAVLTGLHAKQAAGRTVIETFKNDAMAAHRAAREKLIQEMGVTNLWKMTPEQAERLGKLDAENVKALREFAAKERKLEAEPSDEELELKRTFQQLRSEITARSAKYKNLYEELPAFRSQLRATDPALVALDSQLSQLDAQRQALLNSNPAATEAHRQVEELKQQQLDIANQLRLLKIQLLRVTSNGVRTADGQNG